ncbi:MAG: hypothetical protein ACP5N2_06255 [Candidatus Nanoarchaeia archaeon]
MNNKPLPQKKDAILGILGVLVVFSLTIIFFTSPVNADPAGAIIESNVTATAATYFPDNRSDAGGTITTLTLSTVQQDDKWKAYVGNVSGSLTLDDEGGNTIYSWALSAAEVSGELYASRSSNIGWASISCSNLTLMNDEETILGMASTSVDSINRTFNYTTHDPITVAGITIAQDTCRSTSTYVNDTAQDIASSDFTEVLLASDEDLIFMSALNQGSSAYRAGELVDFQIIIPDDVTIASTMYYFYVEIGT